MATTDPLPSPLPETGHTEEDPVDRIARIADIAARVGMAVVIAIVFVGLNCAVMWFVYRVFKADIAFILAKTDTARIVTTEVLMSLIGATVVQVGVTIVAIVNYLFPKRPV